MRIGGLQKISLIDYPGKIAAVLFTQGCNFRCPYCHNPELVFPHSFEKIIPLEDVYSFLRSRKNKLEGVVITGGEPTIHRDLEDLIGEIKGMGFAVKLDTNGTNPGVLRRLVAEQMIDCVAMDVKAPLYRYEEICGTCCDTAAIKESIDLVISSGIEHEFRTTVVKSLHSVEDLKSIAQLVKGAQKYRLQNFIYNGKLIDSSLADQPEYEPEHLSRLQFILDGMINGFSDPSAFSLLFEDPLLDFNSFDDFIFES